MASDFTMWFKEQFGSLPNPTKRAELAERIVALKYELAIAERNFLKEETLEKQYQAALYSKNRLTFQQQ